MASKFTLPTAFLSVGYIGFSPWAPGTVASALTTVVAMTVVQSLNASPATVLAGTMVVVTVLTILSAYCIRRCSLISPAHYDQSFIVIDEVIGMLIALMPLFAFRPTWEIAAASFVLFRFFDIIKPIGIHAVDKRNTPLSVIVDDIMAAFFTVMILIVIIFA